MMMRKSNVMKTATVQEVGRNFSAILKWVEAGEEVQVARDGRPVAVISPVPRKVQHPDYAARLKQTFGDKLIPAEESAAIRELLRGNR
jgi:antitoxin (DNA-binding transcriptional repressor) of toxin-antitoxin stability system